MEKNFLKYMWLRKNVLLLLFAKSIIIIIIILYLLYEDYLQL